MPSRLLLLLAAAACDGSVDPDAVTYTDVGPIHEQHCAGCHQDGGAAPFSLTTYAQAKEWSVASAAATEARSMPPFQVVDDGTCGDFHGDDWLTDDQIGLLKAWADGGAPEGDGYTVAVPELPTLDGDVVSIQTPDFLPAPVGGDYAEFDEYRCFMVDMPKGGFLTGYEVLPGNAPLVHHVIGIPVDLEAQSRVNGKSNRQVIDGLSGDGSREGWPCFTGAGDGVSYDLEVIAWAPGQGPVTYPEGSGLAVPASSKMVLQVHYNMADPQVLGTSDQSTINLRIEDAVDREAYMSLPDLFLGGQADKSSIPAGEEAASIKWSMPVRWLAPIPLDLVAVLPHMHQRGTQMHVRLEREGEEDICVTEVRNWDFNWQRMYMYEEPILVLPSDTLHVECVYDTSDDTDNIRPGWGTRNEMCLPGLLVTLPQ